MESKTEFRGEPYRPQDSNRIFAKTRFRVADGPKGAIPDIPQAVTVIQQHIIDGIVVEGIDSKVATKRVFISRTVEIVPQDDAIHRAMIRVGLDLVVVRVFGIAAPEGRDFNEFAAELYMGYAKSSAHESRAGKHGLDFLRRGICGDVEVLWRAAKQQIPHTATDQVGVEIRFAERFDDGDRIRRQNVLVELRIDGSWR